MLSWSYRYKSISDKFILLSLTKKEVLIIIKN